MNAFDRRLPIVVIDVKLAEDWEFLSMPWRSEAPNWCSQFLREIASATWTVDAGGYALNTPEWEALTGQSRDEVAGDGWMTAVHAEDRARVQSAWTTAFDHHSAFNTDYRIRCADGVYRWFNARGIPILDDDGNPVKWVGVILPIAGTTRFGGSASSVRSTIPTQFHDIEPAALRAARAMLNWSADKLAEEAGISRSTVRRLESERDGVTSRKANVAKVLQVLARNGIGATGKDGVISGVDCVGPPVDVAA